MPPTTRRQLLAGTALFAVGATAPASARVVTGGLPWQPNEAYPPELVAPGGWHFFTVPEAQAVDAIVARLVPADELGPGAKEAGVTTFIDRQLAGPYGGHEWLFMQGPFPANPLPSQGLQSPVLPRDEYRQSLAAMDKYCRGQFGDRLFAQLSTEEQDKLLQAMEKAEVKLEGANARGFFLTILGNTMEGMFSDPIYGGNRDMIGWKLLGFPGTRYDYRDVMANPNKPYTLPPVAIRGQPGWGPRG